VIRSAGRTKPRDRQDARILAIEARDVLQGAQREAGIGLERTAAILAQNAAIRASDAICTAELARHSVGESHSEAVKLLNQVRDGRDLAKRQTLVLGDKTEIGYDVERIKPDRLSRILRNAAELVSEAERRSRP
jgi:hypothetical protein